MASSTLIETININADDFTDNFLTCPTCMSAYDEADHTPKLLPCSHTLCRSCLERIAASATAVTSPGGVSDAVMASSSIATNSIARTIAAADAAVAAMNAMSSTAAALSPSSSSSNSQLNESSRQNGHGQGSVASSRLSSSSLASSSNRNSSGGSGLLHSNLSSQSGAQQSLIVDMCIRCPICRESIILPRNGGVLSLPPSFIINQLLDLVKSKKSRDIIPRCTNHTNEELLFCETCDKSFCSICESHFKSTPANADHIIVPFSIAIKRMAEIYLFKSNQCISSFNLALSNVQNEIINLNSTVENVVQLVDESFNELKRVLDKRRHELFKQLTKIKENKTTLLNEQIKLIVNERQKVEIECKRYQQQEASNLVESKLLGAQIQNINEKLDCLRTLCEPRENSFIDYEYKFNDCMDDIDGVMRRFGRFKISNTYPPLCTARILDDTMFNNALTNTSQSNSKESVYSTSRHLSVTIQIDTVDYYGKKRTEGGDPVSIIITDPSMSRLQYTTQKPHQKPTEKADNQEPAIVDQNNGSYRFTFTPNLIGRYRLDISIFSRSIYQMPIFVVVNEFVDPLWTFGGVSSNASSNSMASSTPTASSSTLLRNFSFHNKGTGDRDFNMPICVRCVDKLIYILDSGNDRIKILNKNGQFVGNIKYEWLNGSSSTALALHVKNNSVSLITLNWRLKSMCKYNLETKTTESFTLAELDEPIAISETFHPDLFIVQDNKRKLYLCTSFGSVLYDSLEARLKSACNIKSVVCFCGDPFERRIFLAGITANNSPSPIYEISLDWLCDFRLDDVLKTLDPVHMPKPNLASNVVSSSTFQAFTYPDSQDQQKSLSSSLTSLTSTVSVTSTTTTLTSNSTGCGGHSKSGQHSTTSSYTALWYDTSTQKLLAAKSDKQKTVIEIFNSCTRSFEYSISECNAKKSSSEKQLKKVTSICSTDDGRFLCVDLVQNLVKFFRFT